MKMQFEKLMKEHKETQEQVDGGQKVCWLFIYILEKKTYKKIIQKRKQTGFFFKNKKE